MKAKYIATIVLCLLVWKARAQQDTIQINAKKKDTLIERPRGIERVFYRDFTKRNEHIFDFEVAIPLYRTIGYNYYYNVKPYFKIGGRFGWFIYNFSKKRQENGCPSKIMDLSIEGLLSFKIWRSINVELGAGYFARLGLDIISGKATPPEFPRGGFCKSCADQFIGRLDFTFTFWKYIFVRTGVIYARSEFNFFFPVVALGFQFNH